MRILLVLALCFQALLLQAQDDFVTMEVDDEIKVFTFSPIQGLVVTDELLAELSFPGKIKAYRSEENQDCLVLDVFEVIKAEEVIRLVANAGVPIDQSEVNELLKQKKIW